MAGGVFSWFASANPDGLEWSMFKTAGVEELKAPDGIHQTMSEIQTKTAFMPDYSFKAPASESTTGAGEGEGAGQSEGEASWPAVSGGTSAAGIVGAGLTLTFAALIGFTVSLVKKKKQNLTA